MRRQPARRLRGFTLLETVLAIAVGSLVLAGALSVLTTMRTTDRALSNQSIEMNDLARTQLAVRRAMQTLHTAPRNTVRAALGDPSEDQVNAVLRTPFPEPLPGVASRFEMTTGTNPRLEAVLSRPLLAPPRSTGRGAPSLDATGMLATVTAEQLPGHRGAFELRREPDAEWPALWWVPLPPRDMPPGVTFDASTLPPPARLCRNVRSMAWTAFIDRQRLAQVRAIEDDQFPAYIELEIQTAGGAYGNWMFELGWTSGPELEAPPELLATGNDTDDPNAAGIAGPNAIDPNLGEPGIFDPETNSFIPEKPR